MRHFTSRWVPCVMVGNGGLELAHAVNERVAVEGVYKPSRILARSCDYGSGPSAGPVTLAEVRSGRRIAA